jgi:hypothetical protein
MHIFVTQRAFGRITRFITLLLGVITAVAVLKWNRCSICGARWWTDVCPRCRIDAVD